jgi:hypothetical protein
LPFAQVVNEQVAHRSAVQLVAVDEFVDAALAGAQLERANGGRRVGREDPGVVQQLVEVGLAAAAFGLHGALGVEQFDAVADRDVGDEPAFAGHNRSRAVEREPRHQRRGPGVGRATCAQSREPVGVAGTFHRGLEPRGLAGHHPSHAGPNHVTAEQGEQPGGQVGLVCVVADAAQPGDRGLPPVLAVALLDSGRQPPLLPAPAALRAQPTQSAGQSAAAFPLHRSVF